ncbi:MULTISPECIES: hypothetical protein [unclassified Nocardiopsis]|uniref:hypothetical protein n=1 Tax=Nocardiopsis TaxID=2013 RepID=UPI00387ADFC2
MGAEPSPDLLERARLLPLLSLQVARGVIVRRPGGEALAARLDADRRLAALLRELRERYGDRPLPLTVAGRPLVLVLAAEDVRDLLERTPDPFSPGGREKRGALAHFQPHGVLVSDAEPGGLAARLPGGDRVRPEDQVAHWLFAFDAAAIAAFRALALLSAEGVDAGSATGDPDRWAATRCRRRTCPRRWTTRPCGSPWDSGP